MLILFLLVTCGKVATINADPASDQLLSFKNTTSCTIGILTTSNGAPVEAMDTDTLNSNLMNNDYFMSAMNRFARERIPDRVVHTKGAGAFGYFEVTHNATNFCKAKLFGEIGKRTPVAVRFSLGSKDKGDPDNSRDLRGFAIKFRTEEGNFDLVAIDTPVTLVKDPILFPSVIRAIGRNPQTYLRDPHAFWDFAALRPESLFFFLYFLSDYGVSDSYRYISGFSVHTYQVYNKNGKSYFMRFNITSEIGKNSPDRHETAKMAALDPDFSIKDLYNAIATGNFPSWKVSIQVLTQEDVRKCKFDPFDPTKILPIEDYPLQPLGRLVLNMNPTNYFAEIEQLAFCPGNLVPGILGGPDKIFQARRFVYKEAHIHRLGVNSDRIRVNCPLTNVFSYDRDGSPPVGWNGGAAPNYFPNSYHGPLPYVDNKRPKLLRVKHDTSNGFDQASDFYTKGLTEDERSRLIKNAVESLGLAGLCVQRRIVKLFQEIHSDLGYKVAEGLAENNNNTNIDFYLNAW